MKTQTGGRIGSTAEGRLRVRVLRLLAALTLVNALLLVPWWVLAGGLEAPFVALEAGVVVGAFAMLPRRRWSLGAAACVSILLVTFLIVGLGNSATWASLGRPLNFLLDIWLLDSVGHLLTGALGSVGWVWALGLAAIVVAALTTVAVTLLLVPLSSSPSPLFRRVGLLVAISWVTLGLTFDRVPSLSRLADVPAIRLAREQGPRFIDTLGERDRFTADLAETRSSYADVPGLLNRLAGKDVILAFVESYGSVALYDPRYAHVVRPRIDELADRVETAGLHIVSGQLVAPSQGGQSWFGHGSLLSGLWLDNQIRYDMLVASDRETLIDDFRRAGHRTAALMPAITMAWPEGERFGYDEIFAGETIDYAGPALNWVTMPDQFTWSFLQSSIRDADPRPVFAEVGLISSHAPWTPILPVLDDWESIADGAVFAEWEDAGESPEELWLDTDRVRTAYASSLDYALHAMTGYAERYVDEQTLLIVLGDHQPAPLITGEEAVWDVPVHVISGDRSLLEPFVDWGFVSGAWPDTDRTTLGMDYFRDWFVKAYSGS